MLIGKKGELVTDNRLLYQTTFMKKLEQLGVAFNVNKNLVCFMWQAPVYTFFCKFIFEGNEVTLCGTQKILLPVADAYKLCSELNSKVNWLKFFVVKHNVMVCQVHTVLNADTAVDECLELLERMAQELFFASKVVGNTAFISAA